MKQVIIIRKDLKCRKGKMMAQSAHASMKAIIDRGAFKHPDSNTLVIECTPEMKEWLLGLFTKVCVGVNSEVELLALHEEAKLNGLVTSLILDAGLTEFKGEPTYTAVAIGPGPEGAIDKITGHLKLL